MTEFDEKSRLTVRRPDMTCLPDDCDIIGEEAWKTFQEIRGKRKAGRVLVWSRNGRVAAASARRPPALHPQKCSEAPFYFPDLTLDAKE